MLLSFVLAASRLSTATDDELRTESRKEIQAEEGKHDG